MSYPIERVRGDFPLLAREVNGQPLAYLDSAASAQKPQAVIDRELEFYRHGYAAVHRGIHTLSAEATQQMEAVREQAARFINAASAEEMVFVKGTTEGINLVANSFGRHLLQPGDAILITEMEHHANIVPWQMLAQERGLQLRVWPLQPDGTLDLARLPELVDASCKLLALTEVSNVLGTVNPVRDIIAGARAPRAEFDGAGGRRASGDAPVRRCSGAGLRFLRVFRPQAVRSFRHRHAVWPPGAAAADAAVGRGGSMIRQVSLTAGTTFADPPWRFEAGSPNSAGIMGLGAAFDYVEATGLNAIHDYEQSLMHYALKALSQCRR